MSDLSDLLGDVLSDVLSHLLSDFLSGLVDGVGGGDLCGFFCGLFDRFFVFPMGFALDSMGFSMGRSNGWFYVGFSRFLLCCTFPKKLPK